MVKVVQEPKYECSICCTQYKSKSWAERCESRDAPNFRYNTGDLVPLNDGCGNAHFVGIIARFIVGRKHMRVYTAENPHEEGYLVAYPESMLNSDIAGDTTAPKTVSFPWMDDKMTNPRHYPLLVAMSIDKREEWDFRGLNKQK